MSYIARTGSRRLVEGVTALLCMLSATLAQARASTYQCGEEFEVKIDFTPRQAQLHMRDKDYTLQRVKSASNAHYRSRRQGLELVANKSDLRLREGKDELQCRLKIAP